MKFLAEDVTKVFRALEDGGVPVWLEGGWAIDALLKTETREHTDLDLVVPLDCVDSAEAILGKLGFQRDERETDMPVRVVFRNSDTLEIDIHPVTFNPDGTSVHIDCDTFDQRYVYTYSAGGLSGVGTINGRVVRCTTAAEQIRQKIERRYSPWSPQRMRANGVSADLEDIFSLLKLYGTGDGGVRETTPSEEARSKDNAVVSAAEEFSIRRIADLSAHHAELVSRHVELSSQHSQLNAQHTDLINQHAALRARFKTMRRSASWRLTAPIRHAAEWMSVGWSKLRIH